MTSSRILILGTRGTVGSAIAEAARDRVVRAARQPAESDTIAFDALTDDVGALIGQMRPIIPKAAIIAFGTPGTHTCASDPIGSRHLNVDRVVSVAKGAATAGMLPVVLSSDGVFDGSPIVWSETDVPNPICEYGRQKLAAERAVAALGVPYLIVRLSRVIADFAQHRDILFQWCRRMERGETILLATDQMFTPIAAADVGRIVVALVDAGVRGLIHVAGPEQISSPSLFERLRQACVDRALHFHYSTEFCRVVDLPGADARPPCTMLSISRLQDSISPRFTTIDECVTGVADAAFFQRTAESVLGLGSSVPKSQ